MREGVAGIVLAGGRSRRFGTDKMASLVNGRPLIHYPIRALADVCEDLVVVLSPDATEPSLPESLQGSARFVRDPAPFAGPLAGLITGMAATDAGAVLIAAGDMPGLRTEVLQLLLTELHGDEDLTAVVLQSGGQTRPLPGALRRAPSLEAAKVSFEGGQRSLLALFDSINARAIEEALWRPLDPAGETLRDVDRPEDVQRVEE